MPRARAWPRGRSIAGLRHHAERLRSQQHLHHRPSGEQLTETDGSGNWLHTNVFAAGQLLATYRRVAQVPGEVITTTESGCPNH